LSVSHGAPRGGVGEKHAATATDISSDTGKVSRTEIQH
jgi:hypothetical protein